MASPNWIDGVYDGGVGYFTDAGDNVTRVDVCTTEPTTHTEATSTYTVGNYTIDNTDFSLAAGDTSGRKATLAQQTGNNGTGTGAANFVAFTKTVGSVFVGVIDGDGDTVNSGSPFTINAVDVLEIRDAT